MTATTIRPRADRAPRVLPGITPRQAGLTAGIGYLLLFVFAVFGNFFVIEALVVSGDPAATVGNLTESATTFRFGIVAFAVIFIVDVVVAWALYELFAPYARKLSLLMAWFRLVYTLMLGVGLVFLMGVAGILGDGFRSAFEAAEYEAQVGLLLDAFDASWMVGLAAFGFHLALLGYLIVRTYVAPRLLGWILVIAGAAYVVDTTALMLLSDYEAYADQFLLMVAIPSVLAELGFTVWLLARAGKGTAPAPTPAMAAPDAR